MSGNGQSATGSGFSYSAGLEPTPHQAAVEAMRKAAYEVMTVQDITLGDKENPIRIRGRLTLPADAAFARLRPLFEQHGYTPILVHEDGVDVLKTQHIVFGGQSRRVPWWNIVSLVLTILSVFYIGLQGELYVGAGTAIAYVISGSAPAGVHAELLPTMAEFMQALTRAGWYTLALLGILGAHEMGHYIVARYHKVDVTLPFFIPLPFSILGTLGAVIAMREPAPNRRVQFDIGIAGPIAGLVVAIPTMVIGLMNSEITTAQAYIERMPEAIQGTVMLFQEGQSIIYMALKYIVFGRVLPEGNLDVFIHPVAFAAWAGLLVTMLNLLPVGQLDGGHILYGLFGKKAARVRMPIIGVLVVLAGLGSLSEAGIIDVGFGWSGWWVWVMMLMFLVRRHAPVLDEITELDAPRRALGVMMLVVFILIFVPRPLTTTLEPISMLVMQFFA